MKRIKLPADNAPEIHPEYKELIAAMERGSLLVNCPWWNKNQKEQKLSGNLFEGCTYIITDR